MEELKIAINAMKTAEIALALRGYSLHWKVRVKANQGFLRRMVDGLIQNAEVPVLKPEQLREMPPEKNEKPSGLPKKADSAKTTRKRPVIAKKTQEQKPAEQPQEEAQPATQKLEETVEELRPVTALDARAAASYLGMSDAGLYDRIKCGRIPVHGKPGNRWFLTKELDQYLESRKRRGLRGK